MNLLLVVLILAVVGLALGAVAGPLFRRKRPYGLGGDLVIGLIVTVLVALLDWFVIPAMGFSQSLVTLALVLEPALGALLVLWLLRRAKGP